MSAEQSSERLLASPQDSVERVSLACITVTHNSQAVVEELLLGIEELASSHRARVITWIVDNASTDSTLERASALIAARGIEDVEIISSAENRGWSAGNNLGLRQLEGRFDAVLLLNPDVRLPAEALDRLIEALQQDPQTGAAVPRLREPSGELRIGALPDYRLLDAFLGLLGWRRWKLRRLRSRHDDGRTRPLLGAYAEGGCVLLCREALEALVELDERFFLYFDDTDVGRRLGESGFETLAVGEAVAEQARVKGSVSTPGGDAAAERLARAAAYLRSELEYYRKWYGEAFGRWLAIFKLFVELPVRSLAWRLLYGVKGLRQLCLPIAREHLHPREGPTALGDVLRGSAWGFGVKVLGAALAFLFHLLLANRFGAEGAGVYFLAWTSTMLAATLGRRGLSNVVVRFTAESAASGDWRGVRGLYRQALVRALLASLGMTALLMAGAPLLAEGFFHEPALTVPLRWMSLAVIPLALSRLQAEALRGLGRIGISQTLSFAIIPSFAILALLSFGEEPGVVAAAWSIGVGSALALLIGQVAWRRATRSLRSHAPSFDTKRLSGRSWPMLGIELLAIAMPAISTWALGIWGTSAEVGVFGIAQTASSLIAFILIGFNAALAPRFAALYRRERFAELESTAVTATRWMSAVALVPFLGFLVASGQILRLFGESFSGGGTALVILAFGQLGNVVTGPVGCLLTMTGHERSMRNNMVIFTLVAILANLALVPPLGLTGAAIASSLSLILMNLVALWLVRSHLGFSTVRPFRGRHA